MRECSGHDQSVMSIRFSPDGKLLASGSRDYTIRIWQRAR
ncbi:WD40 repeat domain-containing protein [Egbenema bharatensis]